MGKIGRECGKQRERAEHVVDWRRLGRKWWTYRGGQMDDRLIDQRLEENK